VEETEHLLKTKNTDYARYLFVAWDVASRVFATSLAPGWSVLCDLLSEEIVLYEEYDNY